MRGNIIDGDSSCVALHGLTMVWREWFWNTERALSRARQCV